MISRLMVPFSSARHPLSIFFGGAGGGGMYRFFFFGFGAQAVAAARFHLMRSALSIGNRAFPPKRTNSSFP